MRLARAPFGAELALLPEFSAVEKLAIRLYGSLSVPTVKRYLVFKHFAVARLEQSGAPLPRRVLDFGCAYGGFGFWLARRWRGTEVYLCDSNPDAARKCRAIMASDPAHGNVRFLDAEGFAAARGFDLVLAVDVIEHIEDDRGVLAALHQRMAPGGHLYVAVPHYSGETLSEHDRYVGHVRTGYTREGLAALLEMVGFEPVARPSGRLRPDTRWLEPLVGRLHARLATPRGAPVLDFENLGRLPLRNKVGLGLLWPLYRAVLEADVALRGDMENSVALLARRSEAPGAPARRGS